MDFKKNYYHNMRYGEELHSYGYYKAAITYYN